MKRIQPTPARSAMKLLCTLLGLILAAMLSVTVYFQQQLSQGNYAPVEQVTELIREAADSFLPSGESDNTIGGRGSDIINILLIGQDRRENEDRARSDSMILCTFNKKTNQLTMTSFLRDLYVPIPGHGSNRINAAYAYGGMELLKRTMEENFDLKIDGSIEVDFSQFASIIDLMGGVEIELRQDEANQINKETGSSLSQGKQLLTGKQALSYSRIRKLDSDGDFSRTNRQRKVMSALLNACKNSSLSSLMLLLDDLLPIITTDLSTGKILTLAMQVLPKFSETQLVSQYVPAEGTYTGQSIDGMSVLVADMEAIREMLRTTLAGT